MSVVKFIVILLILVAIIMNSCFYLLCFRGENTKVGLLLRPASIFSATYDDKILGLKYNGGSKLKPNLSTLSSAEEFEEFYKFHSFRHYDCGDKVHLGNLIDGGYFMCVVGRYKPSEPCLVYSFGIRNDFSFDDAFSAKYGCTVRSYDPFMGGVKSHRRSERVWFYEAGLADRDYADEKSGVLMRTLESLVHGNNDSHRMIDYLKIDIEGNEWPALEQMLQTKILDQVKQFALEIHIWSGPNETVKTLNNMWNTLSRLEERGFRRWYWGPTYLIKAFIFKGQLRCLFYEMVYLNINFK